MNPYEALPDRAFWRRAIARRPGLEITELWRPKFPFDKAKPWVTFGSCFAQHLAAALAGNGFNWRDYESPPKLTAQETMREYNYGVFSARTGNIYTTSLLLQWIRWALEEEKPPSEIWIAEGRYYDPFRPSIEPGGFASQDELLASRAAAISAFRKCLERSRYFVFTMGLTERWSNAELGYEYPVCPGAAAGAFDPKRHVFDNMPYREVYKAMHECLVAIRSVNRQIRVLLTVSPVPLVASNSGQHVLSASTYSKSVLRAVAGELSDRIGWVDYFPSFEIVATHALGEDMFEANRRSVSERGVRMVMDHFFASLGEEREFSSTIVAPLAPSAAMENESLVCEEELLDAFKR